MNIFMKTTWQTMRQNKTRTLVTIIGVILSAAMFTAVTTFCSSLLNFMDKTYIYENGNYHLGWQDVDAPMVDELLSDDRTELLFTSRILGYAEIGSKNKAKPYLFVMAGEDSFLENMPVHLIEGRLPENGTELILPEHLAYSGGLQYALGDKLDLSLGHRTADGELLGQNNPYGEIAETLEITGKASFTVVGFYEDPAFENYNAPGFTALTWYDGIADADAGYNAYVRIAHASKNFKSYESDHGHNSFGYTTNWDVLRISGVTQYVNVQQMIFSLALIFLILIFVGSVSLIYSAFSISVSERTRQFGLLSSIGATKKQLRKCVLTEALTVAAVGVPLGILAGIGGMWVTLSLLGDKFSSLITSPYSADLAVSWEAILAAAVIALLTVLVSAWIPSRRAMRVTAIEAIRQSQDIQNRGKNLRVSKLSYRLYGVEGALARKYYKRSRKKYRSTIFSLAMSIILFISASGFTMYLKLGSSSGYGTADYDIKYSTDQLPTPQQMEDLSPLVMNSGTVTDMAFQIARSSYIAEGQQAVSEDYQKWQQAEGSDNFHQTALFQTLYVDDLTYSKLLLKNGLDPARYPLDQNPPALVLNHVTRTDYIYDGDTSRRVTYSMDFLKKGTDSIRVLSQAPKREGYIYHDIYRSAEGAFSYYYTSENDWKNDTYQYGYEDDGRPKNAFTPPVEYQDLAIGAILSEGGMGMETPRYPALIYPMSSCPDADTGSFHMFLVSGDTSSAIETL